jgi:hypothetical protein
MTSHISATDTAANCSQIKLATCSPAFDGENHLTDRQYTPAVSQSVIADTLSAAADLRFTPIFGNFFQQIVTFERSTSQPEFNYL